MFVRDIYDDIKQVLGYCSDTTLFNRTGHAIEVLSNEGNWDSLQAYLDMTVTDRVVTLPRDVETPVKVNVNRRPTFSRNRLYEFSLNGPGSDMPSTDFSWMDMGDVVVSRQPNNSTILAYSFSVSDAGKSVTITGLDSTGAEVTEKIFVAGAASNTAFSKITRVSKDQTEARIVLYDNVSNELAIYYPDELEPRYRQIMVGAGAEFIRMQYRRRTYKITSKDDWIPLDSAMAILTMLKALEAIRNGSTEELQKVQPLKAEALDFLKKEQASRNNFDLASQTELPSTLDLGYNNADSVIMADIYNDACDIFGPVGDDCIFDYTTDGLEILNNHAQWDGLTGYVDLLTDNHHYITLPRYVETPIAININGSPRSMRNKWFEFHLNGPGSRSTSCSHWDDVGDVVTIRPLVAPVQLVARCDFLADEGKVIMVYGYDVMGKWIQTLQGGGVKDGIKIVMTQAGVKPDPYFQSIARIERITKEPTMGFCQLVGYVPSQKATIPVGYYFPDETEPNYRRIKLGSMCAWVRMRYRKRQLKVTSLTDPLHLRSKIAIVTALRSIKALETDVNQATALEAKALDYLTREQVSRNPAETFSVQFEGLESEVII